MKKRGRYKPNCRPKGQERKDVKRLKTWVWGGYKPTATPDGATL